jgi:hypothetical protein
MANHAATAVDIAESVFEVAVSLQPGRVKEQETLSRSKFLVFFAARSATTVVMEACGSSHYGRGDFRRWAPGCLPPAEPGQSVRTA